MDFTPQTRRRTIAPKVEGLDRYPCELQLYDEIPAFSISITELEQATAERLRVLQILEEVQNRGMKVGSEQWRLAVKDELIKLNMRSAFKLYSATSLGNELDDFKVRQRDHVSHFMLRVSYAETEEKRRWFISREVELFRFRWMFLPESKRMAFLENNQINFKRADEEQKREAVKISNGRVTMGQEYSLIPFVSVADLVRTRKVFLHKGIAYVANDDIISVLMAAYRSNLSQALAYISRRLHILDNDPRLQVLVRGAGKNSRDVDYTNFINKDKIDIRQLDTLAEMSYPLCMKQLHQRLRSVHHLKHFGRQQYGLFLKGIGVSLEDALLFWRSEFTKGMDPDKFERSYAYNVRHMYGREGKRANYAPQNCMKIISAPFAPGQFHGCPFKTLDAPGLTKALQGNGLSVIAQHEVVDLAKKGHYQLACSAFFTHTHKRSEQILIGHPNQYFDESQRVFTGKIVKKEEKKNVTAAKPTASAEKTAKKPTKTAEWEEDMDIDFTDVNM